MADHRGDASAALVPLAGPPREHLAVVGPGKPVGAPQVPGGHPVLVARLVERVAAQPQVPALLVVGDDGVLDGGVLVAGEHDLLAAGRQVLDGRRGEAVDPPVLGPGGGAGEVETPAETGHGHQHRPFEGLGAEGLTAHLGHGLERLAVVGACDDDRDAAAVGERAAYPPGQPEDAVDQHRARGAGPVARADAGGRDDHAQVVAVRRQMGHGRRGHAPMLVERTCRH